MEHMKSGFYNFNCAIPLCVVTKIAGTIKVVYTSGISLNVYDTAVTTCTERFYRYTWGWHQRIVPKHVAYNVILNKTPWIKWKLCCTAFIVPISLGFSNVNVGNISVKLFILCDLSRSKYFRRKITNLFFFSWTKTVTFFPEWVWVMTSRTCTQAVDKFSLNVCCVVGYSDSDFSLFSFGEFWHNSFNTRATAATLLQMPKYL
jgi:hypothetical protein